MENAVWFKPLIWMDYRLAVLLAAAIPLVLLIWALFKRAEAITRLLVIYWRVASLLAIALYLMIPAWRIAFIAGFAARILIPISLWFWIDLNEEIDDRPPDGIKLATTAWRWAMTVYCILSAIASLPFLSCAFSNNANQLPGCRAWMEVPWTYYHFLHYKADYSNVGLLGFLGAVGLCFYVVSFLYFLLIKLGKQGRSAMER
ncbi:DUF3177 family protein [Oscillatoria sp. FACHB-1406]|uniref:DUF3177 family protein n=1 Tax=Oscillatoria sp. FACHB-1406 TaxID=2692846 RepID=UPI0016894A32|nr:DUF3177 family protein [Oscillatoria sp. FACHB-1406]MBD2579197.1 DUF3177 family protein [Oscillatoria sp. FACHB-1406]